MTNEKKMEAPYVCPQCGPDPRGSEEHARLFHTFMHVDEPRYGSPAPTAPGDYAALKACYDGLLDAGNKLLAERDALREQLARVRAAMGARLAYGHNDTCELLLIGPDPMATCTCGHNALAAALPASADEGEGK